VAPGVLEGEFVVDVTSVVTNIHHKHVLPAIERSRNARR
jgi:hypothetical protein